jgi:hypothetical protein
VIKPEAFSHSSNRSKPPAAGASGNFAGVIPATVLVTMWLAPFLWDTNMIRHVVIASCLFIAASDLVAEESRKPNFVVIMVDDMGYAGVSCFGKPFTVG